MIHGGDTRTYQDKYGRDLIDFSSNINPLGVPEAFKEAIVQGLDEVQAYPDIQYRDLRKALGTYLGARPDLVLVGNGAMEIIDAATRLFDKVLIPHPAFGEYEERARVNGKELIHIPPKEDLGPDIGAIKAWLGPDSVLILGNPSNPTGYRLGQEELEDLYQACLAEGTWLILDEAFFEFAPPDYDSIDLFKDRDFEGVIIIRAATKFFAIPGLRLGYGVTSPEMVERVSTYLAPWSVNALADLAGRTLPGLGAYVKESQAYIKGERDFLLEGLGQIPGLTPHPSCANYILVRLEEDTGTQALDFLAREGILIRTCSRIRGLDDTYIRLAVKTRGDNERLLEGLRKFRERKE